MRRDVAGPETRERGQILVLFTLMLVVMILVTGLVVDGGNAFLNRRDAQNMSDIAALAGTKRLADYYTHSNAFKPTDNAYTAIDTRMTQNGCTAANNCTWTATYVGPRSGASFVQLGAVGRNDNSVPGAQGGTQAMGVTVNVTKTPSTYFLGVIGQGSWTIRATASAVAGQLAGAPAGQILPIALVAPPTMAEGKIYALTSGANGPGNFGWLSWTGANDTNSLITSLCHPNNPAFSIPAEFWGDPGKSDATGVRQCLASWQQAGLTGTTVLIPIVLAVNDPNAPPGCSTGGQGNGFQYCIVGLAAFIITGFSQPAVDQINGQFVGVMPYSTGDTVPGGLTGPPALNSSLYLLGLTQ